MKIVHWYINFLKNGGTANAVLGLARAQKAAGIDVSVVTQTSVNDASTYEIMRDVNYPVINFDFYKIAGRTVFLKKMMSEKLKELNPDLLHIHGEFIPENLWAPRIFKCPIVLSPHGGFSPNILRKKPLLKKQYIFVAKKLLYQKLCAFHAISPIELNDIKELNFNKRIYTTPEGPSLSTQRRVFDSERVSTEGEIRFIYVGRMDMYTKGLDLLIEAFAIILKENKDKKLSLAMVGPDYNKNIATLKEMCSKHNIEKNVIFTGRLTGEETSVAINNADIYVQLSRNDGFGLSVIEALYMGKPAILSKHIGATGYDAIKRSEHVKIINIEMKDITSAMQEFIDRLQFLKCISSKSTDRVKDAFSWDNIANEHICQYKDLVKNKS